MDIKKDLIKAIHENAQEATARQTFNAISKQECPDVAIYIIFRAIYDWYKKGYERGAEETKAKYAQERACPECEQNKESGMNFCAFCGRVLWW